MSDFSGTPQLRVLILEDSQVWRAITRHTLSGLGIYPAEAESVEEATQAILAEDFDLVIADYLLPDGVGLDLFSRCNPERINKLILVTGYSGQDQLNDERAIYVAGYLTKPFLSADLVASVQGLFPHYSPMGTTPNASLFQT